MTFIPPKQPELRISTHRAPDSGSAPPSPKPGEAVPAAATDAAPEAPPSPKTKDTWNQYHRLSQAEARLPTSHFDAFHAPRRPEGPEPATPMEQKIYFEANRLIERKGYDRNGQEIGIAFDADQQVVWHGTQAGKAIDFPDVQATARLHTHPSDYEMGARPSAADMRNASVSYLTNKGGEYFMYQDKMYRLEPDYKAFTELSGLPDPRLGMPPGTGGA